jgi:MerR family mercuric resistance operon transcriptional regulator
VKIGEVAKQVGITVETIRFYEKQGLVNPPERNSSGYREYPNEVVLHLSFIRRAKELGFSLKEIKELLLLRNTPEATCGDVREQAEAKIKDMENKIIDLQRIINDLATLVSSCPGQGPLSQCPIIDSIGKGKNE